MSIASESTGKSGRRLSPLGRLVVFALLGIVAVVLLASVFIFGEFDPFILIIIAAALVPAGLAATGWRWAMAVVAVLTFLLSMAVIAFFGPSLARPHEPEFLVALPMLVLMLLAAVFSIWATVQNFIGGERAAPAWLKTALIGLGGLVVGALAVGLIPQQGSAAGISAEALAALPEVRTVDFTFSPGIVRVQAGETVALRLDNQDSSAHTFDIDELGVSAPMPSNDSALAFFEATEPGSYTYYCAIPGHANLEDGTGMIGTLVVVPAS